jgi:hypothetical protein
MKFFDGLIKGLLNPDPRLPPSKGQILVMPALVAFVVVGAYALKRNVAPKRGDRRRAQLLFQAQAKLPQQIANLVIHLNGSADRFSGWHAWLPSDPVHRRFAISQQ